MATYTPGDANSRYDIWPRTMGSTFRMRSALILIALTASPMTTQAKDDIVEWCEQQWRTESATARSPHELADLLERWQSYAPKCAGTVAYEMRLAMTQMFLGDIPRARRTIAAVRNVRSPYAYLVDFGFMMCDYWEFIHRDLPPAEKEANGLEQKFQRVVDAHPEFAEGWAVLGSVQTIREKHAQAVESLNRALHSPGNVTGIYRNLTISYAALARYKDALGAADEAYKRDKNVTSDPYYMCALATANAATGSLEDAEIGLRLILTETPEFGSNPAFRKAAEFLQVRLDADKRSAPR